MRCPLSFVGLGHVNIFNNPSGLLTVPIFDLSNHPNILSKNHPTRKTNLLFELSLKNQPRLIESKEIDPTTKWDFFLLLPVE